MNRLRFAVLVFVVVGLCGLPVRGQLSSGQLPSEAEKSARKQVVMVSAAEGACAGGIVVGFDAQTVYISTAAHIIGDLSVKPLPQVRIRFDGLSGDPRPGTISHFDPPDKGDLAVVNVKIDPALNVFLGQIDFHVLSPVPLPQSDSPVHSIGCSGLTWWKIGNNETLLPSDHDYLRFHSDMEQGQSGGALYTEAWELVGMPLRENGNILSARPVESIVHRLRDTDWNIPVKLAPRALADRTRGPDELARERAEIASSAESRRLAAAAASNRIAQPDLALLLGIEAYKSAPTFEARNELFAGLQISPSLLTTLYQPSGVRTIAFSPEGKTLIAGGAGGTVRRWSVSTHRPLEEWKNANIGVVTAFSPDSKTLAWAGRPIETWRMGLWDFTSGSPLGALMDMRDVCTVVFSQNGKMLASASENRFAPTGEDNIVQLWDVATRKPLGKPLRGHTGAVCSVAFSPDGRTLASASADGTVRLWGTVTHEPLCKPLKGHTSVVNSVAFSPDGKMLASGGDDDTVRLWDVATCKPWGEPLREHSKPVTSVVFSPDGSMLASASQDNTVALWDVARWSTLRELLNGHTNAVVGVAFSPDSKTLASASQDNTVRIWDVAKRQILGEPLGEHAEPVGAAFSSDGQTLASANQDDSLQLWNVAKHQVLRDPREGRIAGYIVAAAFSPNGKTLASARNDDTIQLWDVASYQPLGEPLRGHTKFVKSMAFSPNGQTLASASNDNTIRLWDVASYQPLGEPLRGHTSEVWCVAFSPDAKTLVSASIDGTVRLWDVATHHPLGKPIQEDSWQKPKPGERISMAVHVAFSPNGKTLVLGSATDIMRLWDIVTGTPLGEPFGFYSTVRSVTDIAFSPDGKTLVSADGTVRLWDLTRRLPLGGSLSKPLIGNSLAFSPDGKTLASTSYQRVWLWDLDPNSWVSRTCSIVNRNLSLAEWQQNIGADVSYRRTCEESPDGERVE